MRDFIRIGIAAGFVAAAVAAGCTTGEEPYRATRPVRMSDRQPPAPAPDPREAVMLQVAATYAQWGRADEQIRVAPALCAPGASAPAAAGEAVAGRISAADGTAAHARKLYLLHAKNRAEYLALSGMTSDARQPAGESNSAIGYTQAVVKEAWSPVEVTADEARRMPPEQKARKDGKWYKAGERGDLFVMAKVGEETAAGTDHGWVYGVVTPAKADAPAAVREVGVLRSCAECHQQAGDGRLFGVGHAN